MNIGDQYKEHKIMKNRLFASNNCPCALRLGLNIDADIENGDKMAI
jgi:hypothetical protein